MAEIGKRITGFRKDLNILGMGLLHDTEIKMLNIQFL